MTESANIARHLATMSEQQPDHAAVKIPRGRRAGQIDYLTLSFRELDAEVDAWVTHLAERGVVTGDRVLVMVRQGLPLIAAVFALFRLGAVPIVIDPGMGRKSFLACVERSHPRVLLGIPLAQMVSRIFRSSFASVKVRVHASGSTTARLSSPGSSVTFRREAVASRADDLAAILFTSGSTGMPKGVCYEHGMFDAQVRLVRDAYGIVPGEVDLPMLSIFALFNPALGMTTVVPELDPSRPAAVDPARIVQAIQQEKVTNSFGSPTLWQKIFRHCIAHNLTLPSLRRVLCAGAPVPASLWADARRVLTQGELHSPYGATEALPVASISGLEVRERQSQRHESDPKVPLGLCVGHPLPANQVRIIAITPDRIAALDQSVAAAAGEIGEIIVTGPSVTKRYDGLEEETGKAKIPEVAIPTTAAYPAGVVWHRMGDAGYLDAVGRLWFCGRIAERVVTENGVLYTEPCEQVFRRHAGVARCALIGLGAAGEQQPALVVQPVDRRVDKMKLARELRGLAQAQHQTAAITRFFFHADFPVDVRHNAKIHRLALARWAGTQIGVALT